MYKIGDKIVVEEVKDTSLLSIEGEAATVVSRIGSLIVGKTVTTGTNFSFDIKGRKGVKVRPWTTDDDIEILTGELNSIMESIEEPVKAIKEKIEVAKAGGQKAYDKAQAKAQLKELLAEINLPDGAVVKVTKTKK
jgi:hypothetical protein